MDQVKLGMLNPPGEEGKVIKCIRSKREHCFSMKLTAINTGHVYNIKRQLDNEPCGFLNLFNCRMR